MHWLPLLQTFGCLFVWMFAQCGAGPNLNVLVCSQPLFVTADICHSDVRHGGHLLRANLSGNGKSPPPPHHHHTQCSKNAVTNVAVTKVLQLLFCFVGVQHKKTKVDLCIHDSGQPVSLTTVFFVWGNWHLLSLKVGTGDVRSLAFSLNNL